MFAVDTFVTFFGMKENVIVIRHHKLISSNLTSSFIKS